MTNVALQCRSAGWGCLDCKRVLADNMVATLTPIRERAAGLRAEPARVDAVIADGTRRASAIARETIAQVTARMGFLPRQEV